ncbi:hypothetical protein HZC33_00105 [Candidatus Wolfebacteria bacterium]|nr:hypothetical protein [Candidatus Wolfebacteria bacterium]
MSIKLKLILFFSIFISLILGVFIFYFNDYLKNYLQEQTVENFRALAEASEGTYFAFVKTMKIRTIDWASDGYIGDSVEKILNASAPNSNLIKELNSYLGSKKNIDSSVIIVDILDKNGIVIASSREDRIGVNEGEEEKTIGAHRFSEAIISKPGEVFITNVIYEEDEYSEPMIHLMTRIFKISNKFANSNGSELLDAVLFFHFDKTQELSDLLSGKAQIREGALTGYALAERYKTVDLYLVNKERLMASQSRFNRGGLLKQKVDTLPVKACFDEGKEINENYINYENMEVFGASMCLKNDGLVLIVEAKSDEIFAPLGNLRSRLIFGSIIFLIISIFIIALVSNLALKNLEGITKIAKEVVKNNFSIRSNIRSNDEIGYLSKIFDQMLDSIVMSRLELESVNDRLKNSNVGLEKAVKERTAELEDLKDNLEQVVSQQTKNLQEKLNELERFKQLTVGRELKMMELKKKLEEIGGLVEKEKKLS